MVKNKNKQPHDPYVLDILFIISNNCKYILYLKKTIASTLTNYIYLSIMGGGWMWLLSVCVGINISGCFCVWFESVPLNQCVFWINGFIIAFVLTGSRFVIVTGWMPACIEVPSVRFSSNRSCDVRIVQWLRHAAHVVQWFLTFAHVPVQAFGQRVKPVGYLVLGADAGHGINRRVDAKTSQKNIRIWINWYLMRCFLSGNNYLSPCKSSWWLRPSNEIHDVFRLSGEIDI